MKPFSALRMRNPASSGGATAWLVDVTVDNADVPSTLSNFPLLIHFETLGDQFWDYVGATGGDIRAEIGGSEAAFHLIHIDVAAKRGWGFVKVPSLSSVSDTTITLQGDGYSSLPAANSTYGSEAVWADYEGVWMLTGSYADATGNGHTLSEQFGEPQFDLIERGNGGGIHVNGDCSLIASGMPAPWTVLTLGVTVSSHRIDAPGTANVGIIGIYNTYGDDNDRVVLIQDDTAPDSIALWDSANLYLNDPTRAYTFETNRLHAVLNNTSWRRIYRDGVQIAEDVTTSTAQFDGGNFVIADGANTSYWYGEIAWAYARYEVLSADWLAVEAAMLDPGFASVAGLPAVAPHIEVFTPPSNPASTLTNFPYLIPLAELGPDFWHNVKSDGGDIRVYDGSDASIAFHLIDIDTVKRTGFLFAKQTIGTSGATFKIEVGYPGRSALAATDTYGSEAVWSDYKGVWFFDGNQLDATSNSHDLTVKTGTAAYRTLLGLPALDTRAGAFQSSVDDFSGGSAVYTMACTVSLDENDVNNQQAMTFAQTYGSASNRSTLGNRAAGDVWTTFSADDSWLDGPAVVPGVPVRLACTYNGSTERKLYVDGTLANTDVTITSKTMDTLVIGGGSSSGANLRGRIGFAYLRLAVMSADWLAYEAEMVLSSAIRVESLWAGDLT